MTIAVAEYFIGVVGIPSSLEQKGFVVAAAGLFDVFMLGVVARVFPRSTSVQQRLIVLASIFAGCLFVFYGLFFGAGWFVARYMFPTTPFFCLLWARLVFWLGERLPRGIQRYTFGVAVGAFALALILVMNTRVWSRGDDHQHFQVVAWLRENVSSDIWVGAVQTGTIGFFHDKTINFDGKVNPAAYAAVKNQRLPEYIVNETPVRFIADWEGIARWVVDEPLIGRHFEVIVQDPEHNLAVLQRVTPPPVATPRATR
jgi:hypothetical protein